MKTVKDIGGPADIARICKLTTPTVHGWKSIPERHCPRIEQAKSGAVTCEEMRPDITWTRVKDKAWPNPAGRPLADYARMPIGKTTHVGRSVEASNDAHANPAGTQKPI